MSKMNGWARRTNLDIALGAEQRVGEWLARSFEGLTVGKYGKDQQRKTLSDKDIRTAAFRADLSNSDFLCYVGAPTDDRALWLKRAVFLVEVKTAGCDWVTKLPKNDGVVVTRRADAYLATQSHRIREEFPSAVAENDGLPQMWIAVKLQGDDPFVCLITYERYLALRRPARMPFDEYGKPVFGYVVMWRDLLAERWYDMRTDERCGAPSWARERAANATHDHAQRIDSSDVSMERLESLHWISAERVPPGIPDLQGQPTDRQLQIIDDLSKQLRIDPPRPTTKASASSAISDLKVRLHQVQQRSAAANRSVHERA